MRYCDRIYNYYNPDITNEEKKTLKIIREYIECGNIPPLNKYDNEESYKFLYSHCKNRHAALKQDVKSDWRPNGTYSSNLLYWDTRNIKKTFSEKIKERKKNHLNEIFTEHYKDIWSILNLTTPKYLDEYKEHMDTDFEYELLAFMLTITDIYLKSKKRGTEVRVHLEQLIKSKYGWYQLNEDLINERASNYYRIVDGAKVRAEWLFCEASNNPILNMFIAFGDFLYNPECAKDYTNAPMLVSNILDMPAFVAIMNKIKVVVFDYANKLRHL